MDEKGYHRLLIWQKAKLLVKVVYEITGKFPKAEEYALVSQIRRAAISIVLNIVEGHRRRESTKEFLRFLRMADGSLAEVEACLELSLDLNFINKDDFNNTENIRRELASMLTSFIKQVKNR